jgi:hypothetical protein
MAQNQSIVLELSLGGDHFIWINYARRAAIGSAFFCPGSCGGWRFIQRTDFGELSGTRVSHLLALPDRDALRDATHRCKRMTLAGLRLGSSSKSNWRMAATLLLAPRTR